MVFLASTAHAQPGPADFAIGQEVQSALDINEPIYNGKEHLSYHPSIIGIPYYQTADWQPGTLVYEDVPYKDVFFKYDLVADELVLRHVNGYLSVVLFSPRIKQFTLGDRTFLNLSMDRCEKLKRGIYEQLAVGKLSLFAKRSKLIEEKTMTTYVERKFVTDDRFYVLKDGQYIQVKNEKAILNLFGGQKAAIKSWFKETHLRVKDDPGAAFAKMVEHYNQTNR